MSKQIDWSKAPADATHYNPQCGDWYKVDSDCVSYWSYSHRNWLESAHWNDRRAFCIARPTTPSWSGEGLPPVGVVCEVAPDNSLWGFSTLEIRKCLVIAYHDDFVWLDTFVPGIPVATRVDKVTFRPIRTHEQIEADEREAAIKEMTAGYAKNSDTLAGWAAYVYDKLGYRKP